jgi:hypothetical protein
MLRRMSLPTGVDERLGASRPLLLVDPAVEEVTGPALAAVGGAERARFGGECSPGEIDRVAAAAAQAGADAVVAVGGKAMDTAKAVAHPAGLKLVAQKAARAAATVDEPPPLFPGRVVSRHGARDDRALPELRSSRIGFSHSATSALSRQPPAVELQASLGIVVAPGLVQDVVLHELVIRLATFRRSSM